MDDEHNYEELGKEFAKILKSEEELSRFLSLALARYATPDEAARELGLSRSRVQQLMTAGSLRYTTTPHGRLIPKTALKLFKVERLVKEIESLEKTVGGMADGRFSKDAIALYEGMLGAARREVLAEVFGAEKFNELVRQAERMPMEEFTALREGLSPEEFMDVFEAYDSMSADERAEVLKRARKQLAEQGQEVPCSS